MEKFDNKNSSLLTNELQLNDQFYLYILITVMYMMIHLL